MNNPSLLDWLFDKDNPPDNKATPSDVKMSSTHSNPKTVSFVSTPVTDQPSINSTTTCTKDDDKFLKKMAWALAAWGYKNDNQPDDVKMSSVQTGKVVKSLLSSSVTSLHSSTTHSKSTDNIKNKTKITPPPPLPLSSHKTDTTCTNKVMTNKYVSIGPYESISSSFGYKPPPTPPPNSSNPTSPTPSTPSTKSDCKIREQHRKRCKRKARDQHTKNLEKQVEELQQQLKEKQKEKDKSTSEL